MANKHWNMKTLTLLIAIVCCSLSYAQPIRVPGGIKKPGKGGGGKETKEIKKESPAASDIRMADSYLRDLNTMLKEGDFEEYGKLESRIPTKLKDFNNRITKIEELDPKYDTKTYHEEAARFQAELDKGLAAHAEKTKKDKARKDSLAIVNSPENVLAREIEAQSYFVTFDTKPFSSTVPKENKSQIEAGNLIYARAYFKKDVSELIPSTSRDDHYYATYYIGDKKVSGKSTKFSAVEGKNYIDFNVVVTEEEYFRIWAFNELDKGVHHVDVVFGTVAGGGGRDKILTKGSFDLNVTDAGKAKWQKMYDDYEYKKVEGHTAPKKGMTNTAVTDAAKRAFDDYWGESNIFCSGAYIMDSDWSYKKNAYGTILYRYVDVIVSTEISEGLCMYYYYEMRQENNGGKYGKSYKGAYRNGAKVHCKVLPR